MANAGQMTSVQEVHTMTAMKKIIIAAIALLILGSANIAAAQKDKDEEPTSWIYFTVVKDGNGKPVKNAAVIMHPVDSKGNQERGDLELKTDPDGKANFDGLPYGTVRVQVLAHGFQTYGEDFEISKAKTEVTIKLKRPQGQFSIYQDHPGESGPAPKQDPPPSESKKPN
jgi:hypothetical protein